MSTTRSQIIASADPKGHFSEGTLIAGITPVPGTLLEQDQTGPVDHNGRKPLKLWAGGAEAIVLLENYGLGKGKTDAYAASSHCFLYHPVPGDEIELVCKDTEVGNGAPLALNSGGFVTEGTAVASPFVAMEALAEISQAALATAVYRHVLARYAGGALGTAETTTTPAP